MALRRHPDDLFAAKPKKKIPFEFVFEELASLELWTRPMFGCTAVYVEEKIVFVLRDKKKDEDDGVWVATTKEHHASLRRKLPNLRSIAVWGVGETGWQVLPVGAADFEESVRRACALVREGDARIGKVPKPKRKAKGRIVGKATGGRDKQSD
jgi:hypothetical protein